MKILSRFRKKYCKSNRKHNIDLSINKCQIMFSIVANISSAKTQLLQCCLKYLREFLTVYNNTELFKVKFIRIFCYLIRQYNFKMQFKKEAYFAREIKFSFYYIFSNRIEAMTEHFIVYWVR